MGGWGGAGPGLRAGERGAATAGLGAGHGVLFGCGRTAAGERQHGERRAVAVDDGGRGGGGQGPGDAELLLDDW